MQVLDVIKNIRAGRSPASYFLDSVSVASHSLWLISFLFCRGTIQFLVVLYSCGVIYYIYSACIVCTDQSSRYDDFPTLSECREPLRSFFNALASSLSAPQRRPQAASARERHTFQALPLNVSLEAPYSVTILFALN